MNELKDATTIERKLMEQARGMRTPITGTLELLPLCNMNCDMCFIRLTREEMERKGRLRTAQEWIDMARQMREAGVLFLSLTGGEPLIFPDFRRLYLALLQMGMIVTLNTNGTLLDEEWAAFFGAHKPRRINITLYGSDERAYTELCHFPGGFERARRAVRLLRAQGVDVKINGTIVRNNVEEIGRLIDIARKLDAAWSIETYMFPATRERDRPYNEQARLLPEDAARARVAIWRIERTPEEFLRRGASMLYTASHTPPAQEAPGRMDCMAGQCSFTINWQGEMRPCVMLSSVSAPAFDLGFAQAWKRIKDGVDAVVCSSKCAACSLRAVCGTCAASALHESGRCDGVPEYLCRYTEQTLRCLAREIQLLPGEQDERGQASLAD